MLTPPESFDGQRIRRTSHKGTTVYSLVDIMREFADSENEARIYWSQTKKRLQRDGFDVYQNVIRISMTDKTGIRKQQTDVADAQTCLRIVQSIPSPKAEPVRLWLAQIGVKRLEEAADPELGIQRAQTRAAEGYRKRGKTISGSARPSHRNQR